MVLKKEKKQKWPQKQKKNGNGFKNQSIYK